MKKNIILTLILLSITWVGLAQKKEMKQAKAYLKSGNNLDQGVRLIDECIAKPEYNHTPELYKMAGDLLQKINEIENEKMYLKQKSDTIKYFTSMRRIFEYYERCDSVERDTLRNPKQKFKYRKNHHTTLKFHRKNLLSGGLFFVQKNNHVEAFKMFDTYLFTLKMPMFADEKYTQNDTIIARVAYLATLSAHSSNDYKNVLKHHKTAAQEEPYAQYVLEYAAKAYKELGDTLNWIRTLEEGLARYPAYTYFFVNLSEYSGSVGNDRMCITYADRVLAEYPNNTLALYVKVLALMNMKEFEESITVCNTIIKIDPEYVEAHYNIALANTIMAENFEKIATANVRLPQFKADQQKLKKFYAAARPHMEKVRQLLPNNKEKWASVLYLIYLKLNMGKELEEIDRIIKQN